MKSAVFRDQMGHPVGILGMSGFEYVSAATDKCDNLVYMSD